MKIDLNMSDQQQPPTQPQTAEEWATAYRVLQDSHTSVMNQMNQQQQTLQEQNTALAQAQLEASRVSNQQLEMERKELIKMLHKNLKTFKGERNAQELENFIRNFEMYAEMARLSTENKLIALTALLTGNAETWWINFKDTKLEDMRNRAIAHGKDLMTMFLEVFRKEFTPLQHKAVLRAALHDTDLRKGLLKYVQRMRRLIQQLGDVDNTELVSAITHRIDGNQEMHLRSMNKESGIEMLDELEVYAYANEKKSSSKGGKKNKDRRFNGGNSTKRTEDPHFMDVDAVRLRDGGHNNKSNNSNKGGRREQNNTVPTMENYADYKVFPYTTDKLRDFLREKKACFYCRTFNATHMAKDCPKKQEGKKGGSSKN